MTAPVNHNKLNQNKALQIVNTILGNVHQHKNKTMRQNQDFGLNTCIIIGYDDNKMKEKLVQNFAGKVGCRRVETEVKTTDMCLPG